MSTRPVMRVGDFHAGHKCVTFHATPFVKGSSNVFVNGKACVRFGDNTACTDTAVPVTGTVFVNGLPIATTGSPTSGHEPCFPPTVCANGSDTVFAKPAVV